MKNRLGILAASMIVIGFFGATDASAQSGVWVDAQGEFGVGTSAPAFPLHVISAAAPSNTLIQLENTGPARFRFKNYTSGETWNVGHQSPSGTGVVFSDTGDGVSEMLLDVSGNLTIAGTLTAGNPPSTFPDYVFAPDYELMPLHELSTFVSENRHLPNVPSADDISKAGKLNMSEFQYKLLEKIEELTLYTLQQQKDIEALRAQVKQLQDTSAAN